MSDCCVPLGEFALGADGLCVQVVLRYFMGYWPAKIPTLLNIVLMVCVYHSAVQDPIGQGMRDEISDAYTMY